MAIKHLHYTDLATSSRQSSAQRMLTQLRDALRNPANSDSQREAIRAEIQRISVWVSGGLAVPRPDVPKQDA